MMTSDTLRLTVTVGRIPLWRRLAALPGLYLMLRGGYTRRRAVVLAWFVAGIRCEVD